MKIRILLLLLLADLSLVNAQSNANQIKEVFNTYRSCVENKEYDKAFDFYPDTFLVYIPKEQLKKQFNSLDSNKIEYSVTNSQVNFISEMVSDHSKKYAFVKYNTMYHYTFKKGADSEYIGKIQNMFRESFGENYSYSEKDKKISIYRNMELVAIKDKEWQFIPYKETLNSYMHLWIPETVFKDLLINRNGKNLLTKD